MSGAPPAPSPSAPGWRGQHAHQASRGAQAHTAVPSPEVGHDVVVRLEPGRPCHARRPGPAPGPGLGRPPDPTPRRRWRRPPSAGAGWPPRQRCGWSTRPRRLRCAWWDRRYHDKAGRASAPGRRVHRRARSAGSPPAKRTLRPARPAGRLDRGHRLRPLAGRSRRASRCMGRARRSGRSRSTRSCGNAQPTYDRMSDVHPRSESAWRVNFPCPWNRWTSVSPTGAPPASPC